MSDPVGPTPRAPGDGWREVERSLDGRLVFDAGGRRVFMTLEEAKAALPEWEFFDMVHNGEHRVWAR